MRSISVKKTGYARENYLSIELKQVSVYGLERLDNIS